jgi:NADH-quinone oxidoreductase subunit K/NAD(P)H-quinone oxidoreductase subunit 4L
VTSLVLASVLVAVGLYGVLVRRDIVAVLASIEVMLGGAQLLLAAYAAGVAVPAAAQGVTVIVLATVAVEAAVGLALLVALVRRGKTRTEQIEEVRG